MANNCLVTKLNAEVQNNNLLKMGEVKIGISATSSPDIYINPASSIITVKTSDGLAHIKKNAGDSYASSLSFSHTSSIWNNHIICEQGNYSLIIDNKYSIEETYFEQVILNIDDFAYSSIKFLQIANCDIEGSKFNKDTVETLNISISNGTFDVANIANASVLKSIKFGKGVYGNLSVLDTINSLNSSTIDLSSSSLEGDITYLNKVSNIQNIAIRIGDGSTHTETITGDLSSMSNTLKLINAQAKITNFTWLGSRSTTAPAISLKYCNLGEYVDAMLKNQAQCDLAHPWTEYDKEIIVTGIHDPEDADANAAINTFKAAGWTVTINNEEM